MLTLEQAITQYGQCENFCKYQGLIVSLEELNQITAWLRELQERRKEPKRVKGRWIEILSYKNHTYKCSECGRLLVNVTDGRNNISKRYPYCHCGADMKGYQNEVRTP
jgi:hypothetical protein